MAGVTRPRLLDLYCCAGGAGMGYHRAGFEVVGVDINPQPRYPFGFVQADALDYLADHAHEYQAIHASPPCQAFTAAGAFNPTVEHPDLLTPTRAALEALAHPYVLENVSGAPMGNYVTLCGSEFGLRARDLDGAVLQLKRHRQFESNVWLWGAGGCQHDRAVQVGSVFGYGGGMTPAYRDSDTRSKGYVPHVTVCAQLVGVDWKMTKRELSECIPPAYTQWLGSQLIAQLGT